MGSTEGYAVKAKASESSFQRPNWVLAGPIGQEHKLSLVLGAMGTSNLKKRPVLKGRPLLQGRSVQ